jgi:hypothetical protein
VPLVTAGAIVAANPGAPEELAEELAEALPAVEDELSPLADELPSVPEEAASRFQDIVRQAQGLLHGNPDLIQQLGGSSRGAPITANQLQAAAYRYFEGNPGLARALEGNAMEALVNAIIEDLPAAEGSFLQVSGPGRIDFIGTGAYTGLSFELTTEAAVAAHALRVYLQEAGAMIFTYLSIIE